MKKVLVTGANGFVCSNIVNALLKHDYFVYAVDLYWDNPVTTTWPNEQVEFITSNCDSLPDYDVNALIHGAAFTADASELGQIAEDYFNGHLQPTLTMMRYAQKNVSGRSVFISSSAVYREMSGITSEETPSNPLGLYAVAKQTTESLVDTLKNEYDRDICCVRLGNVYGPHEYSRESRPRVSIIRQMIESAKATKKLQIYKDMPMREWTFAPDIGNAIVQILNTPTITFPVYNVASGQAFSWREIAEAIAISFGDVSIEQVAEPNSQYSSNRSGILDNQRLQQDVNFTRWTPLLEGIQQTISYTFEGVGGPNA